jgi:hypothetical protein
LCCHFGYLLIEASELLAVHYRALFVSVPLLDGASAIYVQNCCCLVEDSAHLGIQGGGEASDPPVLQVLESFVVHLLSDHPPSDKVVPAHDETEEASQDVYVDGPHVQRVSFFWSYLKSIEELPKCRIAHGRRTAAWLWVDGKTRAEKSDNEMQGAKSAEGSNSRNE